MSDKSHMEMVKKGDVYHYVYSICVWKGQREKFVVFFIGASVPQIWSL